MFKLNIQRILFLTFIFWVITAHCYNSEEERIKKLRDSAIGGNADSCLALGNAYFYGKSVSKDLYSAFDWYFEAAEKGNPTAQFNLALCYDQGLGTEVNKIEALRWYKKASDAGVVQAKYNLAMYYKTGENFSSDSGTVILTADMPKAIKLLYECSNASFAPANRELAKIYLDEKDPLKNKELGMKLIVLAAQENDPEALYMLAKIKLENGTALKEVFPYIKMAAENNIVDSFESAGVCYETGRGVDQDKVMAFKYYKMAAENNIVSAQVRLGEYYFNGILVKTNIWNSAYWFKKAAEQNDPYALFMLGSFAEQGIGEAADKKKALKYYMKSAQLGFPRAQYNLAMYYANDKESTNEDSDMAYHWLRKAALQDDSRAQKELGFYCIMGQGTEQNYSYGLNWLSLSSKSGETEAKSFLEGIKMN